MITREEIAIEAGEWKKAKKMLDGKWWSGYDNNAGCPREEFIGALWRDPFMVPPLFSMDMSYADLVYALSYRPGNYRIVSQGKTYPLTP